MLVPAVALIALAGFAITLWSRPADPLSLYTSPKMQVAGRSIRVQMLVPSSWTVGVKPGWPAAARFVEMITAAPGRRLQRVPAGIRKYFTSEPEPFAGLTVFYGMPRKSNDTGRRIHVMNALGTQRAVVDHGGCLMIYSRTDPTGFDATYRQVCESLRVIDQP
jgi:hypothetical protein